MTETQTKFRWHRGGLNASMQTVVLVHDRRELIDLINAANGPYKATEQNIEIEFYAVDDRIGWNTYLVSVDNKAVGMTDGPL